MLSRRLHPGGLLRIDRGSRLAKRNPFRGTRASASLAFASAHRVRTDGAS